MAPQSVAQVLKELLFFRLLPLLAYLLVWLLYLSCKKRYILPEKMPKKPVLIAFWHGELLMQPFIYKHLRGKMEVKAIISEHKDGRLISNFIRLFGLGAIKGSTSRGGKRALLESIRFLRAGGDVAITPDGPRGPFRSIADGVVAISQKAPVSIVVFRVIPGSFWQLGSWDRFRIPKPFCRLSLIAKEPFEVDGMELEAAKALVYKKMAEDDLREADG